MARDHGHAHEHDHHVTPSNFNIAFIITILLNLLFIITKSFYAWVANSTALMADAGHNLSNVLGLFLVLGVVPSYIRLADVEAFLIQLDGVTGVHDLHIWAMSTTENAMTVHLVMPDGGDNRCPGQIAHQLEEKFSIHHVTIRIRHIDAIHDCTLSPK